MSAEVLEKPDTHVTNDDGDHERLSHYVHKADWERAYLDGATVTAQCGKQWNPHRDPGKYPVCPDCREVVDGLPE